MDEKGRQVPLKIKLACYITLLIVGLQRLFASGVDDGLKQLWFYEKEALDEFFQYSIECESLGYVLFFGNKPACSIGCSNHQKGYREILRGWEIWEKYEHLFPHPNFIFCNTEILYSDDYQMVNLYVINKTNLLKCISDNESVFKKNFGESFSKEEFINFIEITKDLDLAIGNNEILRGIILGFGEESANAFYEQNISLYPSTLPPWTDTYCSVGDDLHCRIYSIGFMGNPHSDEVKRLLAIYREEREQIHKKFCCSRKKLRLVLETLCQY